MATTTMTATAPGTAAKACEVCGNTYEHTFQLTMDGQTHTFDSFECAIHVLAPLCRQCRCRIIGHGIEAAGVCYCGAHCARAAGITAAADHVGG